MTTHLEETLQRDLDAVRSLITRMADLAVRTLRDCVVALGRGDHQLASVIILRDQLIDQMERELDRSCLEFILRHQPVGGHLRFIYAALQLNFQLERIGDYAESVARQILKLIDLNCQIPSGLFRDITSASISMLYNAVTAFVRQDVDLARVTAQIEEQVDVLQNQVNSELMHLVQSNQLPLAALTPLMTIARRFERVSDQAKSICQETLYICTGEYAKHPGGRAYRVLFVDEDHGCRSRMAEAIGQGIKRTEFTFSSAGLEPRPLDPRLAAFLRQKGVAVDPEPRRLPAGDDFHQYEIVIALSPSAKRHLAPPSRKTVQLEWLLPDPCIVPGPGEEFTAAGERAYGFLSQQVSGLIAAVLGEEPMPT